MDGGIEMLSRRSVAVDDYGDFDDSKEDDDEDDDGVSLKIDLSMAEQFYYEVIASFQKEEVKHRFSRRALFLNARGVGKVSVSRNFLNLAWKFKIRGCSKIWIFFETMGGGGG